MNPILIVFLVISAIILFLVIALVAFLLIVIYFFRSFSGVILFRIDYSNNRVLRLSNKQYFLSTIFDSKISKFNVYHFVPWNNFLNFFEVDIQKKLKKYLEGDISTKEPIELKFKGTDYQSGTLNLTFFENIIRFLDKKIGYVISYKMTITPDIDLSYSCSITWNRKREKSNEQYTLLPSNKLIQTKHAKNLIIALALKPYYFTNLLSQVDLEEITNLFWLPGGYIQKGIITIKDGFLILILKELNKFDLEHVRSQIIKINQNHMCSKYFLSGSYFVEGKIFSREQNDNFLLKIKYAIYNIINNNNNSNNFLNLPYSILETPKFQNFVKLYNIYMSNNINDKINNNVYRIKTFKSKKETISSLVSTQTQDLTIEQDRFFKSIPYLNYLFESRWFEFIKESYAKHTSNPNYNMVKVSQEVFLETNIIDSSISPTHLVYAHQNMFDYDRIKQKIKTNFGFNIPTALYVDVIDKPLINVVNYTKLKAIVIGKKISTRLNETSIFFDCINIVNLANNNNIQVIFEDVDLNLDILIVQKARIKAFYTTNN